MLDVKELIADFERNSKKIDHFNNAPKKILYGIGAIISAAVAVFAIISASSIISIPIAILAMKTSVNCIKSFVESEELSEQNKEFVEKADGNLRKIWNLIGSAHNFNETGISAVDYVRLEKMLMPKEKQNLQSMLPSFLRNKSKDSIEEDKQQLLRALKSVAPNERVLEDARMVNRYIETMNLERSPHKTKKAIFYTSMAVVGVALVTFAAIPFIAPALPFLAGIGAGIEVAESIALLGGGLTAIYYGVTQTKATRVKGNSKEEISSLREKASKEMVSYLGKINYREMSFSELSHHQRVELTEIIKVAAKGESDARVIDKMRENPNLMKELLKRIGIGFHESESVKPKERTKSIQPTQAKHTKSIEPTQDFLEGLRRANRNYNER